MARFATIYDICDAPILHEAPAGEPGRYLKRLYQKTAGDWQLKYLILKWCRHSEIPMLEVPRYQSAMRAAMQSDYRQWRDPDWIDQTFAPIAGLLDRVPLRPFRQRQPVTGAARIPDAPELDTAVRRCLQEILKTWHSDPDPYFPVAAQVVLTGDDRMDGKIFLEVLHGVGAFEHQNAALLFGLIRCFLFSSPRCLQNIRKPYPGIAEKLFDLPHAFQHRTAFYDAIFFELLLTRLRKSRPPADELPALVAILENLLRFCVVTSREWLISPARRIRHPAITCLPQSDAGETLSRLSPKDRSIQADLGFADYAPDTDTTFLTLSVARQWLDFVRETKLSADESLLAECRRLLSHPWIAIIDEYQVGSSQASKRPILRMTRPLDYHGAIPIWFDKPFSKSDGRIVRNAAGNEICPGHNMDILESMLANRKSWNALEGNNLPTVRRLLDFHYRAFADGHFRYESAYQYYLPEIYMFYTGRLYEAYLTLDGEEKAKFDPENRMESIRRIALDYCRHDLAGYTMNPFDAALAVNALVLLRPEPHDDGLIARGLETLLEALGTHTSDALFDAYEWTRLRHPCRIIVGSPVATTLFAMSALVNARHYLYGNA